MTRSLPLFESDSTTCHYHSGCSMTRPFQALVWPSRLHPPPVHSTWRQHPEWRQMPLALSMESVRLSTSSLQYYFYETDCIWDFKQSSWPRCRQKQFSLTPHIHIVYTNSCINYLSIHYTHRQVELHKSTATLYHIQQYVHYEIFMYKPIKILYTAFTWFIKNSLSKISTRHCLVFGCFVHSYNMYSKRRISTQNLIKTFFYKSKQKVVDSKPRLHNRWTTLTNKNSI